MGQYESLPFGHPGTARRQLRYLRVVTANRELAKSKSIGLTLLEMKLPAVPIQQAYAGEGE
jgi:hypothetical protein